MSIQVRYFAAAKAAVGRSEERLDPAPTTIGELVDAVAAGAQDARAAAAVFDRCSYLHNGRATTDRRTALTDGDTVDVLPPFAGG
ncbi:MoaD/ThiS family protein [Herbiconiux sp. CPCC 205716]|uniref:MoaD/ThiS family protein n=1 Tax=Herbiconiux gentiana TaxID=2970912 RepID=A0ABT2GK83_9MICO|nr:MoaD/ThiS family protein [Herbiconiux gentiana]MCS5715339.1 MoaD/ThiS family protein [Herbiconiux gentiana]